MKESSTRYDGISTLRRWITWAAVVGTALWAGYFFVFLIYQSIVGSSTSDNWFLRMVQEHPAATIGVAMSAITAFCLVALLEIARGPIEFEALGFKFKGASGPVILWVFCFLAMIFGVWLLWDKAGTNSPPGVAASNEPHQVVRYAHLDGHTSGRLLDMGGMKFRAPSDFNSRNRVQYQDLYCHTVTQFLSANSALR